jgi:hypothetical protein
MFVEVSSGHDNGFATCVLLEQQQTAFVTSVIMSAWILKQTTSLAAIFIGFLFGTI